MVDTLGRRIQMDEIDKLLNGSYSWIDTIVYGISLGLGFGIVFAILR